MWHKDPHGTELDDADAAREELRRRAQLAIGQALKAGYDNRHKRVRLRDERGVIFEGTLAEAAAVDPPSLEMLQPQETVIEEARRLRLEAAQLRMTVGATLQSLMGNLKALAVQCEVSRELVKRSRAQSSRMQGRHTA